MTVRQKICRVLAALTILLATVGLWAHHSPSAIFDMSKRVAMGGTLTKIDWINPHIVVYIDGKAEDGKTASWVFESNPPAWFRRVGVGRADFAKAIGQTVKVEGVLAKDGSLYGYLQKITFADGSSMELANAADESR
jgi:Family of unknown function (DUF6152)